MINLFFVVQMAAISLGYFIKFSKEYVSKYGFFNLMNIFELSVQMRNDYLMAIGFALIASIWIVIASNKDEDFNNIITTTTK